MTGKLSQENISLRIQEQRVFFLSGKTLDYEFRVFQLKKLLYLISENEKNIIEALKTDLGKPRFESIASELQFSESEVRLMIRKLRKWMRPVSAGAALLNFPSRSFIYKEPFGVSLILSPWNYPFLLCMNPLAGAMAAGNCAVIKPSEFTPATAGILESMVNDNFPEEYVHVVNGDTETGRKLLNEKYDLIFFTGSARVGRMVAESAAKNLTPVILELGGKSPCIVNEDYDIPLAAKRIAWGKFFNCGQTCIAPDYLFVHEKIHDRLVEQLKICITGFYGDRPDASQDYGRIINGDHYERLVRLIHSGQIVFGGDHDPASRYIGPTLIDRVAWEDGIMREEIFGPVLPILTFRDIDNAIDNIREKESPLSCYLFTHDQNIQQKVIRKLKFGGGAFNDTVSHFIDPNLPFGGIGMSGHGSYHGRYTFEAFSHKKGIVKKGSWIDIPLRYPPYSTIKEKVLKITGKFNLNL
ncbi:MAG TPA: aldehyde dehydrogenase [Cyclobacteriaceae bacterium]|nr:aldehyde dehydrogenase [Cyclobacteriaceae bacterium]